MKTLFDSNRGEDILVHIITDGLKPETTELLHQLARHFNREIDILTISDDDINRFDLPALKNSLWGPAAAYRLIIGKLFPNLHRILYLDTDLLIRKSLRPLWDTDLSDNVIAGVQEWNPAETLLKRLETHEKLGYPIEYGYINSGVILYDLDRWRALDLDTKLVNDLASNFERYKFYDQDVINVNLHQLTKQLPLTYNVTLAFYIMNVKGRPAFKGQRKLLRDPAIIHFTTREKPWHKMREGGFYLKRKTVERYINMEPATPNLLDQEYAPEESDNSTPESVESASGAKHTLMQRAKVAIANVMITIGIYDYIRPRWRCKMLDPYPD
jgi:lipopolysaccharide biosynthesis glycosyltransferase